jgi:hypothetical protein
MPRCETIPAAVVPGIYAAIRESYQRNADLGDPRAWLGVTDDPARRRRLSAKSPAVRQDLAMVERMNRGKPITVSRARVARQPGSEHVGWLDRHPVAVGNQRHPAERMDRPDRRERCSCRAGQDARRGRTAGVIVWAAVGRPE